MCVSGRPAAGRPEAGRRPAWRPAAGRPAGRPGRGNPNFKKSTFPEDATFREIPPRMSSSDSDELVRGGISRKVAPSGKVDFSEPGGFSDVRVHVRAAERALGGARPGCSAASRSLPSTSAPLIGIYTDQWQGNAQQAPRGLAAERPGRDCRAPARQPRASRPPGPPSPPARRAANENKSAGEKKARKGKGKDKKKYF